MLTIENKRGCWIKVHTGFQTKIGFSLLLVFLLTFEGIARAGSSTAKIVPQILFLLLDEDETEDSCLQLINVGDVELSQLDPLCPSQGRATSDVNAFARYFTFTHKGGALHIDLISDYPKAFDTYLFLREGHGRNGPFYVGDTPGTDDNSHDDFRGSRLIESNLPAGDYTIEVSSFSAQVDGEFNLSVYGTKVTTTPSGKLNDTGIAIAGTSNNSNSSACDGTQNFSMQDCSHGRDSNRIVGRAGGANNGDGHHGFSFLKISARGEPLTADALTWDCVKDNVTGLMWEVKDALAMNLRYKGHNYMWYNIDSTINGGDSGHLGGVGVSCHRSVRCDTKGYVDAVNTIGLCGYQDWRLPTVTELFSILNAQEIYNLSEGVVDKNFFPNTPPQGAYGYWTIMTSAVDTSNAFTVDFGNGEGVVRDKSALRPVRLVRGGE